MPTTEEKLKAIANKYVTPFIYDNLVVKKQYITISEQSLDLYNVIVFAELNVDQRQNVMTSLSVLNEKASDIGATGYLDMAPKVAAEIYDVMIGDGYTCTRGDKATYVEYYVNVFKNIITLQKKNVNIFLTNYTQLSLDMTRVLVDPCSYSKHFTSSEMDELWSTNDDPATVNRKVELGETKLLQIARQKYTANKECGVGPDNEIILPPASISQIINVEAVVNIVNKVYTDAFNSEDFYKPSGPPPPPPPPATTPPKGGFPVWAMLLIALGICLFVGGLIILSGDSNNN
jgi:hypothetical protein